MISPFLLVAFFFVVPVVAETGHIDDDDYDDIIGDIEFIANNASCCSIEEIPPWIGLLVVFQFLCAVLQK